MKKMSIKESNPIQSNPIQSNPIQFWTNDVALVKRESEEKQKQNKKDEQKEKGSKIKSKAGIGLISIIIGMTIFATIAIGATKWAVQLQRSTITTEDKMTAMSLAYNKWLEYIAQDYDKVSSEGKTTSVNKKFDIQADVSSEKTLPSGGTSKPVVITVFKAGTDSVAYALTAEKVNPSLDEFYTKAEVDGKLKALESSMDSKLNNLQNQINTINTTNANQQNQINDLYNKVNDLYNKVADLYNRTNDLYNRDNTRAGQINDLYSKVGSTQIETWQEVRRENRGGIHDWWFNVTYTCFRINGVTECKESSSVPAN